MEKKDIIKILWLVSYISLLVCVAILSIYTYYVSLFILNVMIEEEIIEINSFLVNFVNYSTYMLAGFYYLSCGCLFLILIHIIYKYKHEYIDTFLIKLLEKYNKFFDKTLVFCVILLVLFISLFVILSILGINYVLWKCINYIYVLCLKEILLSLVILDIFIISILLFFSYISRRYLNEK